MLLVTDNYFDSISTTSLLTALPSALPLICGMRTFMTGAGGFDPMLDLAVIAVCAALSILASAWFFERIEI